MRASRCRRRRPSFIGDQPTGFDTGEQYGFAVKKGNAELLKAVNDALSAARADGTYDKIYAEWIGEKQAA